MPQLMPGNTVIGGFSAPLDPKWKLIPDMASLDALLADHKVHVVAGVGGHYISNNQLMNQLYYRLIQKDIKKGYTVWNFEQGIGGYRKRYYKNIAALMSGIGSDIWQFLYLRSQSRLYDTNSEPPPAKELKQAVQWNPIAPEMKILRARNLSAHYGHVYMARLFGSDKGKYVVWADDAGVFVVSQSAFRKKYGDTARYDLKFYDNYPPALDDFLSRKPVLKHALPLSDYPVSLGE